MIAVAPRSARALVSNNRTSVHATATATAPFGTDDVAGAGAGGGARRMGVRSTGASCRTLACRVPHLIPPAAQCPVRPLIFTL